MDREELPFNREQRNYAYRAAKNVDTTVAFGSTRDLRPTGTVMFVNCPFPTLEIDAAETSYEVRDESDGLDDTKLQDIATLEQVKMFEIKLSQGAKPGKGGILPARKVTSEIAKIRGIPIGKDSISPNRLCLLKTA